MQVVQQKHRWFSKNFSGWYELFKVQFSPEEKEIFASESPEKEKLSEEFRRISVRRIDDPPIKVLLSFQKNHNPEKELVVANINEHGHGIICEKNGCGYTSVSFFGS